MASCRFLIRVDANPEIALGHLKRCMALAEGLKRENCEVLFVCLEDDSTKKVVENSKFSFRFVSDEIGKGNDLSKTLELARGFSAEAVIIDSYSVNGSYTESIMGEEIKTIYIDDLAQTKLPCHGIINGMIGAEHICYDVSLKLLGKDFLLLGKEYWNPGMACIGEVSNVLITMGGIDHYCLSEQVLVILEKHPKDFSISVVIGPYYENEKQIDAQMRKMRKKVCLIKEANTLFYNFEKSDMAISAGGFTLYELATMGKPTIGVGLWENQRGNVERLGERQVIEPLFYSDGASFDRKLEQAVFKLLNDGERRRDLAVKGQRFFDGQGAIRAARELSGFVKGQR